MNLPVEWTSAAPVILASFMASMVEFVEALTIVLAVGTVRGWRPALLGAGAALALLALLVLALGPALARIPLAWVQGVVGTLLLLFGLRWLRKAVLRAAGVLALHDEAQAFADETAALRRLDRASAGSRAAAGFDNAAFATAFKIVMLEGIEVVFIVIALGASGRLIVPATIGALLALLLVVALGVWLHRPLARVPENALKFGVGVMLAGFGTFWVGEGVGLAWPGGDGAALVLLAAWLLLALALVPLCRRARRAAAASPPHQAASTPGPALWHEVLAFFVDDGWLAAGVIGCIALTAAAVASQRPQPAALALAYAAALCVLLAASALRRARARR